MLDISQPAHEASLDSLDPEHLAVTPVNFAVDHHTLRHADVP